jgi:Protein of unknown function (DUF5131)
VRTLFIEYDRTRRIDKNYDKPRRYDAFLCWWVRYTPYADGESLPYVVFVCQDEEQREEFVAADDRELTGHRWHPTVPPERHERELRNHCAAEGVAFFFKQWGGIRSKSGGRLLDGRTWDETPAIRSSMSYEPTSRSRQLR